jgi:type IV pilus assembly protein PilE
MKRSSGFTLIELMITVVIVAILVSVALPSYQRYVARAVRASGQQFLTDLAQRQEQYFLDVRQYATGLGTAAGQVNLTIPDQVATKYQAPVFTVNNAAVPPTYTLSLVPVAGSVVANDGALYINNLGQRWRETDGNGTFDTGAPTTNCAWENTSCSF